MVSNRTGTAWGRRAGALAVAIAAAAITARAADAPLCDDCKFLPCVNIQLAQEQAMRQMYRDVASRAKDMAQYTQVVQDEGNKILDEHSKKMQAVPACKFNFPVLDPKVDYMAYREWAKLGWGFEMRNGEMAYLWSAVTDVEQCKLREDQLKKSREIVACVDLAEATEAHERAHVKQCGKAKPEGPQQFARFELGGYDAGIARLRQTQKRLQKKCKEPHAQRSTDLSPAAMLALKNRIDASTNRINMYLSGRS